MCAPSTFLFFLLSFFLVFVIVCLFCFVVCLLLVFIVVVVFFLFCFWSPALWYRDVEIKIPSVENSKPQRVSLLRLE